MELDVIHCECGGKAQFSAVGHVLELSEVLIEHSLPHFCKNACVRGGSKVDVARVDLYSNYSFGSFNIEITLTKNGLAHVNDVVSAVFKYA